mgnify:FL=1
MRYSMGVYLMYQALVNKYTGTVLQFIKGGSDVRFETHEDFMWVTFMNEIDNGCAEADYKFNLGLNEIQKIEHAAPPYDLARRMEYPDVADQLDMLYHDMESGKVPGKDSSNWYSAVKDVKENNPKP